LPPRALFGSGPSGSVSFGRQRYLAPPFVRLTAYDNRATADRARGGKRTDGGLFCQLRLQLRDQSRMVRSNAAAVGKSYSERALGDDLFDLPCPGRPRGGKSGSASNPGSSSAQQVSAPLSEISQFPISATVPVVWTAFGEE